MPKAKRAITIATPAAKPVSAKPVAAKPAVTVPAVAAVTKPADISKPVPTATAIPAATVAAKPATDAATMPRGLTRDAAGIVRAATNYAQYSDRDTAYLAFFGSVLRTRGHVATLRDIHDAGITRSGMPDRKRFNPNYTGSGKATDIGVINRLIKAGYLTSSNNGNTLHATDKARATAVYLGSKA